MFSIPTWCPRWFPATGPPGGAHGQATFTADRQAAADGKLMQRRITHHLDGAGIPWGFTYWSPEGLMTNQPVVIHGDFPWDLWWFNGI